MIQATVNGHTISLGFRHTPLPQEDLPKVRWKELTSCVLLLEPERDGEGRRILGTGVAKCSQKDVFDKERGRKLALTRALAVAFPYEVGKPLRTAIWAAYHGRR